MLETLKAQSCIAIVKNRCKVCYVNFRLNMSHANINMSLLTLVFIHLRLMLFWKSLRICFFHICDPIWENRA